MSLLHFAYLANILILTPVLISLFATNQGDTIAVFDNLVRESEGLRLLIASLWSAILVCSVLGLMWPERFLAILVLQVIYKFLWLALFIFPVMLAGQAFPTGISLTFAAIVLVWPFIIYAHW